MGEKLLKQDVAVLDKIALENYYLDWEQYKDDLSLYEKKRIECAVVLSRLETEKIKVPIVSVEWLEKLLEREIKYLEKKPEGYGTKFAIIEVDRIRSLIDFWLKEAAKKEAGRK